MVSARHKKKAPAVTGAQIHQPKKKERIVTIFTHDSTPAVETAPEPEPLEDPITGEVPEGFLHLVLPFSSEGPLYIENDELGLWMAGFDGPRGTQSAETLRDIARNILDGAAVLDRLNGHS